MNQDEFVSRKKEGWEALASLSRRAGRGGLKRFTAGEIRLLGSLYRRVSSDLSYARSKKYAPDLIRYLNQVVRQAYGVIYLSRKESRGRLWDFFARDYPALVRKYFPYVAVAMILFFVPSALGFFWGMADSRFSRWVVPRQFLDIWDNAGGHSGDDDLSAFPAMSGWYLVHNFRVGLYSFVTGIFLGLGTFYMISYNGLILGAVLALVVQGNSLDPFANFILSHCFLELFAIFICGGAGFLVGRAVISPGDETRAGALNRWGKDAVRLAVGTAPLFLLAGIMEASYSRLAIPTLFKAVMGGATILLMMAYFSLGYDTLRNKVYLIKQGGLD